jgi:hypothetical protein
MSGPKVVQIVTREEIIATCEGLLARLDAAVARWQRVGRRNRTIDDGDVAAAEARRTALRALLASDQFVELQKQVPLEIAFFQDDLQLRLQRAAAAVSDTRRAERRMARTAQSLLDALARSGTDVPDDLRRALVDAGQGRPDGEAACAQAFALLHRPGDAHALTERQRQIADALGHDEPRVSFADWMARQPSVVADVVVRRIDGAIADLIVLAGAAAAAPFQTRAATLNAAATGPQRDLLADSLLLDLVAELKHRQADAEALGQLEEFAMALARFESTATRELRAQVDAAIASGDAEHAAPLAALVTQAIAAEEQAVAAAARREAVLKGLARLGYEVTEGMATAWVEEGRVVLRNTARPGYGVEIGGGVQAGRMQVRAVALGDATAPRDTARDSDIETLWCGDVTRLTALLAEDGDTLTIERALPVGATPLKVIAAETRATSVDDVRNYRHLQRE